MPISKSGKPTPAQAAASRENGRKSKGPKTLVGKRSSSLNGLKSRPPQETVPPGTAARADDGKARPLWQTMVDLGEDPGRYRSKLRDVIESYPPRSPVELGMCEDITRLMLNLERTQRAQEARLVRAHQKLETAREKQLRLMERSGSYDALQADVLETGLRRAPDSPGKFAETMACLERLRTRVEGEDCSDETELSALYGKNPTFRGAGIINAFRELAQNPDDRELAASLRHMILEEIRDVATENQLYYREHIEITRAMRLECLAPADREYLQLQRYEASLRSQLERDIKLLVALQAASRRKPRRRSNQSALPLLQDEPLGWLDSAQSGRAADVPAKSKRAKSADSGALAIALRHKLSATQASGPDREQLDEDAMTRIRAIYGLDDPADKALSRPEPHNVQQSGNPEAARGVSQVTEQIEVNRDAGSGSENKRASGAEPDGSYPQAHHEDTQDTSEK